MAGGVGGVEENLVCFVLSTALKIRSCLKNAATHMRGSFESHVGGRDEKKGVSV